MQHLTPEALLEAVRQWVAIESPTQDVAAVNHMADHAEALLVAAGARIERIPGQSGRYVAQRNYLTLTRRSREWLASWQLEDSGRSPDLPL